MKKLWLIMLAVSIAAGAWAAEAGPAPAPTVAAATRENLRQDLETFQDRFIQIKRRFVNNASSEELLRNALRGMVNGLGDPYSSYLTPDNKDQMRKMLTEESPLTGIGVQLGVQDNKVKIIAPVEDTPAWRAGLQPGDVIEKVDGTEIHDVGAAQEKISGKDGTKVQLSIVREGVKEPLGFTLVREPLKIKNVEREVIHNTIGYLRLKTFTAQVGPEVFEALRYLRVAGCKAYLLDLRYNPGGFLNGAVEVADQFLPGGLMITYTQGRDPNERKEWKTTGQAAVTDEPLVVLVNEGSASAAEIVTGALKDHHRATIVGVKTFGKGSVQEIMNLPDGSGLKLTVAKYFTPSGICIHEIGIKPDKLVEFKKPENLPKKPKVFTIEERLTYDNQLAAGVKVLEASLGQPKQ